MKNTLLILIVFSLNTFSYGQKTNYKLIRDSLTKLSCTKNDSLTVVESRKNLEAFNINQIKLNIDMYYDDLGMCYYLLFAYTLDSTFIQMASETYDKALVYNAKNASVLWQKSFFNYFFFKDCEKGKYFMERYKKATPKKYWSKEEMSNLSIGCE